MFLLLKFKEKKSILEANFETACQPVWNLMLNGFVVLEANSFILPKIKLFAKNDNNNNTHDYAAPSTGLSGGWNKKCPPDPW